MDCRQLTYVYEGDIQSYHCGRFTNFLMMNNDFLVTVQLLRTHTLLVLA